jgi:hypothetical protein
MIKPLDEVSFELEVPKELLQLRFSVARCVGEF